jgi:hypothetical protein
MWARSCTCVVLLKKVYVFAALLPWPCWRVQITRHEEFWSVSPLAALLMLFQPGPPQKEQA